MITMIPTYPEISKQMYYPSQESQEMILSTYVRKVHNDLWYKVLVRDFSRSEEVNNERLLLSMLEAYERLHQEVHKVLILYKIEPALDSKYTQFIDSDQRSEEQRLKDLIERKITTTIG